MSDKFAGKVALVTGASSGIGRATAMALATHGAAVMCVGTRESALQAVVAEITAAGGNAAFVTAWLPGLTIRPGTPAPRR